MPLEKLLQEKPDLLDAPGRLLYRAHAIALVDLLRRAPEGPARLGRFIMGLRLASNDPMANLRTHFPQVFPLSRDAEKIWERHVAQLAAEQPFQLLSAAETERRLNQALRLKFPDRAGEKSYDLAEFPKFLKHLSTDRTLARLVQGMGELELRANPIYRSIISDYAKEAALLKRGKTRGLGPRLERLRAARHAVTKQMRGIDDYLDWFEATQLRGPSGVFADYLKAAESAARPPQAKRDPISIYLDALETQFEN